MSNSTRSASIYGLFDLSDPYRRVRYVGQTSQTIHQRLSDHLAVARKRPDSRDRDFPVYTEWLCSLNPRDVGVLLLDTCSHEDRYVRESYWIEALRTLETGFNVSNGCGMSAEHRLAWIASAHSPAARAKQDAARYGRVMSDATIAKIRATASGGHVRWHVNRNLVSPDCEYCCAKAS